MLREAGGSGRYVPAAARSASPVMMFAARHVPFIIFSRYAATCRPSRAMMFYQICRQSDALAMKAFFAARDGSACARSRVLPPRIIGTVTLRRHAAGEGRRQR